MSDVIGEFRDHDSLRDVLRLARETRNVSYETVDEIGGLARGHSSKLLALGGSRKITLQTLTWLLGALALKCIVVSDTDALARINGRMKPRDNRVVRNGAIHITLSRRFLSEIGRKGARRRHALRIARKEAARKAARARWHGQANGGGQCG